MMPNDPIILLSYVNTKLRDEFSDLSDLCSTLDVDPDELCSRLAAVGYRYHSEQNRFL